MITLEKILIVVLFVLCVVLFIAWTRLMLKDPRLGVDGLFRGAHEDMIMLESILRHRTGPTDMRLLSLVEEILDRMTEVRRLLDAGKESDDTENR